MKKTFRISIKVKNCDIVFKEGLEPGSLGFVDMTYDLDEKEFKRPLFLVTLSNEADALKDELIEYNFEEIK